MIVEGKGGGRGERGDVPAEVVGADGLDVEGFVAPVVDDDVAVLPAVVGGGQVLDSRGWRRAGFVGWGG